MKKDDWDKNYYVIFVIFAMIIRTYYLSCCICYLHLFFRFNCSSKYDRIKQKSIIQNDKKNVDKRKEKYKNKINLKN